MKIGPNYLADGNCEFRVWAPLATQVDLAIRAPGERLIPMDKDDRGYWSTVVGGIAPGTRYAYRLDGSNDRPDPASAYQPEGIDGPSEVVDHAAFAWQDRLWPNIRLEQMVIYELHVGTFTPAGTFRAIVARLDELRDLGITAIELMPVAQFPGERNWGYDGVYPFAVQNSYGGPEGLRELVNAAHQAGLGVILDVVYNHIGCEGNRFADFGPYFTSQHKIRWGQALNFDGPHSDEVRNFFIQNALSWFRDFHIDGLRLDAVDAIKDLSAKHFLRELAEYTEAFSRKAGREFHLIAESDLNDARILRPTEEGGYGIHAQWSDDFHHALHALLTGDRGGYYIDYGKMVDLADALQHGFVYRWRYSAYKKRHHGSPTDGISADRFVVFSQNHDQVGNRYTGERLAGSAGFEAAKLAATVVMVAPYVPLMFMGEEYAEDAPFVFFAEHFDPALIDAVRQGRRRTLEHMGWHCEPPDPQSSDTYLQCKLRWESRNEDSHRAMLDYYRALFDLRRSLPALAVLDRDAMEVSADEADRTLYLRRWHGSSEVFCLANFDTDEITLVPDVPEGTWTRMLDSARECWLGPGSDLPERIRAQDKLTLKPRSIVLYKRVESEEGV